MDDLTNEQLAAAIGCSVRQLRRYTECGLLPEPVRYSHRLVRWPRQLLVSWLATLLV